MVNILRKTMWNILSGFLTFWLISATIFSFTAVLISYGYDTLLSVWRRGRGPGQVRCMTIQLPGSGGARRGAKWKKSSKRGAERRAREERVFSLFPLLFSRAKSAPFSIDARHLRPADQVNPDIPAAACDSANSLLTSSFSETESVLRTEGTPTDEPDDRFRRVFDNERNSSSSAYSTAPSFAAKSYESDTDSGSDTDAYVTIDTAVNRHIDVEGTRDTAESTTNEKNDSLLPASCLNDSGDADSRPRSPFSDEPKAPPEAEPAPSVPATQEFLEAEMTTIAVPRSTVVVVYSAPSGGKISVQVPPSTTLPSTGDNSEKQASNALASIGPPNLKVVMVPRTKSNIIGVDLSPDPALKSPTEIRKCRVPRRLVSLVSAKFSCPLGPSFDGEHFSSPWNNSGVVSVARNQVVMPPFLSNSPYFTTDTKQYSPKITTYLNPGDKVQDNVSHSVKQDEQLSRAPIPTNRTMLNTTIAGNKKDETNTGTALIDEAVNSMRRIGPLGASINTKRPDIPPQKSQYFCGCDATPANSLHSACMSSFMSFANTTTESSITSFESMIQSAAASSRSELPKNPAAEGVGASTVIPVRQRTSIKPATVSGDLPLSVLHRRRRTTG